MQDSREENLERYKSQIDIHEENKVFLPSSQFFPQEERNLTQIRTTQNELSNELYFLNKKRPPPNQFFPFYFNILSTLSTQNETYARNKPIFINNLSIFNNIIEDYVINVDNPLKKNQKKIGICSEDIYQIPKYKINLEKLPKFGRITDHQIVGHGMMACKNTDGKIVYKRKIQNYSSIEKQNKETKKFIELVRQKYKNCPKNKKEKMDNSRLKNYWIEMSKHDIPKFPKIYQKNKNEAEGFTKRLATLVQKEIKKKVNRVQRAQKECNIRARKLQKEMLVFWRKREKEMSDIQRKKDKIENDKKKKEDELQEQIIQKKRMEYLLKQSDIYSVMMYKHLGAFMPQDESNKDKEEHKNPPELAANPHVKQETISGKNVLVNTKTNKIIFQSIRVDIDEKKAKEEVQMLIDKQRQKATEFDQNLNKIRKTLGGDEVEITKFNDGNQNGEDVEMSAQGQNKNENVIESLDKPMINNSSSQLIEVPKNFNGELKEYQLKGLRWLDNLYEQGINGILADEMGLGKTIQAIAFLAHLSEEKNNWGPFLVIAPNATLYNWQQEFNRFCPSLKVLPYWGALKERKTLRKFFNSSQLYVKSSAFHVCITSYQLIVSDEKVFHKVNWNYMILDEAQAIKNIASQRWNVLLSFNCRNRLLLSGTPIQNSMSELWALLHFIMPKLFDSHEQFQEWFSKDIEAHSQDKGELNKEQLKRLHKILKPFMLRRVKKDVEHEIGPKVEYEIPCEMTERQKILYNSIKEKLSNISDLFMSTDSKVKVTNLMNLVMQFRKVFNHPELFERNFGKIPFTFRNLSDDYGCNNTFTLINGDMFIRINTDSIIQYHLPKMIYDLCYEKYNLTAQIPKKLNIYDYDNISNRKGNVNDLFNFTSLLGMSLSSFLSLFLNDLLINHICLLHFFTQVYIKNKYYQNQAYKRRNCLSLFISSNLFPQENDFVIQSKNVLMPPLIVNNLLYMKSSINHKITSHKFYIPKALGFTPKLICSNSQLEINQRLETNNLMMNKILYGVDFMQFYSSLNLKLPNKNREILSLIDQNGLMTPLFFPNEGYAQIELPSFDRLISDCAKLKKLDELLKKMHKENHRVLIFCQMTHMIDILEEYMAKRKYSYFRMDGSTNIADRRDMINEFQTNPKIFAFLLSTRAGGLGVNLTGADTVIFYDNDWNPTMDAQATDRAHRIGQTKLVSVYRLITANTIEERILKRAKQKQNVQTTVYSGGAFKADIFKQSDIVELLYSEEEMQKMEQDKKRLLLELNNGVESENVENENSAGDGMGKTNNINKKKKKKEVNTKKDKKNSVANSKKKTNGSEDGSATLSQSNSGAENKKNGVNNVTRNIFSVKNKINDKGGLNAIKLDSSDDENNIIIDDGEHPINFEDDDNNMEID